MSLRKAHKYHIGKTCDALKAELSTFGTPIVELAPFLQPSASDRVSSAIACLTAAYWEGFQIGDLDEAERQLVQALIRINAALEDVRARK